MSIFSRVLRYIIRLGGHRKAPTYIICHRCMGTGKICNTCQCNEHACQCAGYHHKLRICPVCHGSGRVLVYE